ncbi:MAG: hypothetical protein HY896_10610 [Deltaproteobacteria bacterium]|nr:hypothetical protein [Deltaproteobacteria bacterium]
MSGAGWKAFSLHPDDLLFFRDGKPSARGEDHYLRSLFPPNPSTLYGALRTRRLMDEGISLDGLDEVAWRSMGSALRMELGEWGGFGEMTIRGPWLVKDGSVLLPVPADLGLVFKEKSGKKQTGIKFAEVQIPACERIERMVRYRPVDVDRGRCSHPLALMTPFFLENGKWEEVPGDIEPEMSSGWFLKPEGIIRWMDGILPDKTSLVHRTDLWLEEMRTGVGLKESERTHEEHQLYTFGHIRLKTNVALGFEVSGSGLAFGGHIRIGGEGRTARLDDGPLFPFTKSMTVERTTRRVAVCLGTHSLTRTGVYFPGFSERILSGSVGGIPCRLVGAVVKGHVLVGGWDLARKEPKSLRRAIPAGSVFVFETTGEEASTESVAAISGCNFSDAFPGNGNLKKQGFGLALAGASL